MALRIAVTAEPVPSHVSALDYVIGPALAQGHDVALYAPPMFRREARPRGVGFHRAGTDWTCDPAVQRVASGIWRKSGNASFNRHVFGRLWPERAEAKARDLIAAWTRARPALVVAECSDLGAHLAAAVLRLPVWAADNGLGPVLLDLWDTDVAPALTSLHERYGQDAPSCRRWSPPRRSTGSTGLPRRRPARSGAPSRRSGPPAPGWTASPPPVRSST
nr:hypothetical protein KitaXyl93_74610 [Kitasatospora sp. Xyl93]